MTLWESLADRLAAIAAPPPSDPVGWARDKLGAHLWSKQVEIAESVCTHRRTAVKSCHGAGKSWTAGMLASWWIDTHSPGEAIVVSTAPTYKQVHAVLWEEIRKQHRIGGLPGRVTLDDEWKIGDVLVGMGRKPADHDAHGFQGIHRRFVLVILDEACGIPAPLWAAVEAITTNDDARILAIGNPDDPNTEFGKVCSPGSGWNVLKIDAHHTPNLSGEPVPDALRPLLPSREWVEDAATRWGTDSPMYQSKVLGEFPEASELALIKPAWITAAQERTLPPTAPVTLGVDVARYGTDRTIVAHRQGGRIRVISDEGQASTTATSGRVIQAQRDHLADAIRVDGVGVGGGVVDMLAEQGYPVEDMQAGGAARDPAHFVNARAEWYWGLREAFESGQIDIDPTDDQLAAELGALRFEYDSRGRIKIESKDDLRARTGGGSPDRADALALAFAIPKTYRPPTGLY